MRWGKAAIVAARRVLGRRREVAANLVGLAVALWVLYPVFFHAFVWRATPSLQVIAELRSSPSDAILAALEGQRLLGPSLAEGPAALALADRWLATSRDPAAAEQHPIVMQPTAADLTRGAGIGALPFSSLYAAEVFVSAFRASGNAQYLATARDLIIGYARYERTAWRDRGFLWNDHAIAARVGVITRFWASYRSHPLFAAQDAAEILQHLSRSVALLAAPSHFTAWSNHGVMQNIALLQAAAAFPGLIDAANISRLALDRLTLQLRYYVSDEGVVLEHSADYHHVGHALLVMALKLAELNQLSVPAEWREKLRLAELFLLRLTRPDGTLPAHGDTRLQLPPALEQPVSSAGEQVQGELALYPLSGYAAWTANDAAGRVVNHSMVTWSHFEGHAHKHADESELSVWADGRGWITSSGYAPYGSEFRAPVEGWLGSNAAHGDGETVNPQRHSELLGSARSALAVLLDIRRGTTGEAAFRRQIVSLAGGRWLVIDHPVGELPWLAVETLWTFYPDLVIEPQGVDRFLLRGEHAQSMAVMLASGAGAKARASGHRGGRAPFAGWVATESGMQPAPALRVVSAATGWTAALFSVASAAEAAGVEFTDGEHWRASGPGWWLQREGASLESSVGDRHEESKISAPPDTRQARAAIKSSLETALQAYPKYRNLDEYRFLVAQALGGLWLLQVLGYLAVRPVLARRRWLVVSQAVIVLPWLAVAVWLSAVYFAR